MGAQHPEPTAARSELQTAQAARIRLGRFTQFLQRGTALALTCLGLTAGAWAEDAHVTARVDLTVLSDTVDVEFGGLSGVDVSDDGAQALLLSDRGFVFRADLFRDAAGRLTSLQITGTQRLRHDGEHRHPDSEGLAFGPNGRFYVAAEGPTRVLRYSWGNKDPDYLPDVPTDRPLDTGNRGFEALARGPSGALWTVFETPERGGVFPLYAFENGVWRQHSEIAATPGFAIVGADFDRQGRLYLLERAFSFIGFRTQIRVLESVGNEWVSRVIFASELGAYGNLEGLAIWHPTPQETRILLVSDDNFLTTLPHEMLELSLKE